MSTHDRAIRYIKTMKNINSPPVGTIYLQRAWGHNVYKCVVLFCCSENAKFCQ